MIEDDRIFSNLDDKDDYSKWLAIAEVIRVDSELQSCDVKWLSFVGFNPETRLALGHRGIRTFMGAIPDVGDFVACGFIKNSKNSNEAIIVSTILRNTIDKNTFIRGYDETKLTADKMRDQVDISLEDRVKAKAIRNIVRKLYPGEVSAWSKQGGLIRLDEHAELADCMLDKIKIDSELQAIVGNALSFFMSTEAGRFRFGMAMRNVRTLANSADTNAINNKVSKNVFNSFLKAMVLPSGRRLYIPTSPLSEVNLDASDGDKGRPWVEHMVEMPEICDGILDTTEFNADHDLDNLYSRKSSKSTGGRSKASPHEDIFIRCMKGTLIGNDPKDLEKYGKVLLRRIFEKFDSSAPVAFDKQYIVAKVKEEERQLASLFHLIFLRSGDFGNNKDNPQLSVPTAFDVTKEGVLLFSISSSSDKHKTIGRTGTPSAPKSTGTSIEGYIEGLTKLLSGRSSEEQESLRYDTKGRITLNIGKNDITGASIEEKTVGGIRLRIGKLVAPTNDNLNLAPGPTGSAGDSLVALFEGGINLAIGASNSGKSAVIRFQGNVELVVDGNYKLQVNGNYEENITGTTNRVTQGNLTEKSRRGTYQTTASTLEMRAATNVTGKAGAQMALKAGARIKMNAGIIMEN